MTEREVVAVQTERREVRTKTTESQYPTAPLEQGRLVSSLLYGTRATLVSWIWRLSKTKQKYTDKDLFYNNGPYGKIPMHQGRTNQELGLT